MGHGKVVQKEENRNQGKAEGRQGQQPFMDDAVQIIFKLIGIKRKLLYIFIKFYLQWMSF
jgi:hypothetical protein